MYCRFAELKNSCYVNYTLLKTFYSGISKIFSCEVINVESSDRW